MTFGCVEVYLKGWLDISLVNIYDACYRQISQLWQQDIRHLVIWLSVFAIYRCNGIDPRTGINFISYLLLICIFPSYLFYTIHSDRNAYCNSILKVYIYCNSYSIAKGFQLCTDLNTDLSTRKRLDNKQTSTRKCQIWAIAFYSIWNWKKWHSIGWNWILNSS